MVINFTVIQTKAIPEKPHKIPRKANAKISESKSIGSKLVKLIKSAISVK